MLDSTTLPVILVSKNRPEFLLTTLSCLAQSTVNLDIELVFNQEEYNPSYAFDMMLNLLYMKGHSVTLSTNSDKSLAAIRAGKIKQFSTIYNRVLMLDNDVWFEPNVISSLENASRTMKSDKLLSVAYTHKDLTDERNHPDWSNNIYSSHKHYLKDNHGHTGGAFTLYNQDTYVPYTHTHSVWNIPALIETKTLDLWSSYPKGKRGYDYIGSREAVKHSEYRCKFLANTHSKGDGMFVPSNTIAFWHLWLNPSDQGYFDTSFDGKSLQ